MQLTPREKDKLLIAMAAEVARKRLARGVKLNHPEAIALTGASHVPVLTTVEDGFRASVEQLEAARTDKTKAVLFVSPSNPTGSMYSRDEIEAIGRWAVEHDLWVITDEIYEHLVYGDNEHHSMPVVVPGSELGLRSQSFKRTNLFTPR